MNRCSLCGCAAGTKHHLHPKSVGGGNGTIYLCRFCHDLVHLVFSHLDLAQKYSDENLLVEAMRQKGLVYLYFPHVSPRELRKMVAQFKASHPHLLAIKEPVWHFHHSTPMVAVVRS